MQSWDGSAWEQHCLSLGKIRSGVDFQEIPGARRRDLGVEGFSFSGCTLQCYAATESLSTKARYGAQRDRFRDDPQKA